MPTGTHLLADEICDYWRDRFKTALQSELGLLTCMSGSIDQFPATERDLSTVVPAIFVKALNVSTVLSTINGLTYEFRYRLRVVYVDKIAKGANVETRRARVQRIADVVLENYRMHNPAPDSGTYPKLAAASVDRIFAVPNLIDFRPPEDSFVVAVSADLFAAATDVETWVMKAVS